METIDLRIVDLARELLMTTLALAGPVLLVGLVVGVMVSLFQALTSVQEQTMALVPKMMAVMLTTLILLLVPLAGLTSLFGSFEANRVAHPATNTAVVVGVMVVIWGFARLALGGFVATDSATVGFLAPLAVLLGAWLLGITTLGRAHGGVGSTPS